MTEVAEKCNTRSREGTEERAEKCDAARAVVSVAPCLRVGSVASVLFVRIISGYESSNPFSIAYRISAALVRIPSFSSTRMR